MNADTFADAVIGCLAARGTDRVFAVPGEATLALLAAAGRAGMTVVATRHESGAGFAAIADAQLTGRPGLVAVNRSPGAANVGIAVDTTRCDPTPLVVVVGAPARGVSPDLGYQSAPTEGQLGGAALCVRPEDEDDLANSLRTVAAELRRPAPRTVVLIIAQDLWACPAPSVPHVEPARVERAQPDEVDALAARLDASSRPVVIVGPEVRADPNASVTSALQGLAGAATVPLIMGNKRLDLLDHRSDAYCGDTHQGTHPRTRSRLSESDLVVFLGEQPWEVDLAHWHRGQPVVTVHPARPDATAGIRANAARVLAELTAATWTDAGRARRRAWVSGWRALELDLRDAPVPARTDGVDPALAMIAVSDHLTDDAVVCLDAGNFGSWVHRYLVLRDGQRLLAVADGSMGSAVPAAMAVANRFPRRQVVAVVGDGGVMMTGNELLMGPPGWRRPAVIVVDNNGYGAIRSQGARMTPGADVAADLHSPDWVSWAYAMGVPGSVVSVNAAVRPAVAEVLRSDTGRLLVLKVASRAAHANFDLPA